MCAFCAHIGDGRNRVAEQLMLHIEVPLLHVRPDRFCGYRVHPERSEQTGTANAAESEMLYCVGVSTSGGEPSRDSELPSLPFVAIRN